MASGAFAHMELLRLLILMLLVQKQHSLQVVIKLQANRCCFRRRFNRCQRLSNCAIVHDKEGFET